MPSFKGVHFETEGKSAHTDPEVSRLDMGHSNTAFQIWAALCEPGEDGGRIGACLNYARPSPRQRAAVLMAIDDVLSKVKS